MMHGTPTAASRLLTSMHARVLSTSDIASLSVRPTSPKNLYDFSMATFASSCDITFRDLREEHRENERWGMGGGNERRGGRTVYYR